MSNEIKVEGVGQRAQETAHDIGEKVGQVTEQVKDQVRRQAGPWLNRADDMVRENPTGAIIGAILVGFTLGALVRAMQPEPHPVREYMDETSGKLRSLFAPLSKGAQRAYESSSDAIRGAAHRIAQSEPLSRRSFWHRFWE